MPGAFYRQSSSGRDRTGKRDEQAENRLLAAKGSHPANTRRSPHHSDSLAKNLLSLEDDEPAPARSSLFFRNRHEPSGQQEASSSQESAKTTEETFPGRMKNQRAGSAGSGGSPVWQVRLTPSMLLMMSILLLVTLGFFFLFGLIIGRSSAPPMSPPQRDPLVLSSQTSPEAPEHILPEEDLRFMTTLRSEAGPEEPPLSGTAAQQGEASRRDDKAEVSSPRSENRAENARTSNQTPAAAPDKTLYDYVIQAAAFKSEDQADALRARLEGEGLRTRLVREAAQRGTWYHVRVLFRGTADHAQQLRDSLKKYGVRDTIVVSRTPVAGN